jgi:uncharacterized HAD superfamily protein
MATIAIDIDGVVCEEEKTFDRPLAKPIPGALEYIQRLYDAGHVIVFWTARGWEQYRVTSDWLNRHGFSYHALSMGKPIVDIFIDDRAIHFESWEQAGEELKNRISDF